LPSKSVSLLLLGLLCCAANTPASGQNTGSPDKPQGGVAYTPEYTKDGRLVPPSHYREWIFVTSGLGMNYGPNATMDHVMFDNVFVNPEAYRSFLQTGTWPDKTVLVLELRGAKGKGSINKNGHYQDTELMGVEAHVKDESRFPGKWAFFDIDSNDGGTLLPQSASCYSCHAEHAAVDTTFVQFYPTLLPIAQKKATLSPAYLKELDLPSK
jgi:Cytochrome P460